MVLSSLFFALMAPLVKVVGNKYGYESFDLVFVRSLFGLAFTGVLMWQTRAPIIGHNMPLLIARGLVGLAAVFTYYIALQNLPNFSDAVMLQYTSPIFVGLLAPFLLRERARAIRFVLIAVSFVGMLMIVKQDAAAMFTFDLNSMYALIGLASGLAAGLANIIVRKATATDNSLTVMFYFPFISTIATAPFFIAHMHVPGLLELLMLCGIGVLGTLSQVFLTVGLKYETATRATILTYSAPVFALVIELLIFANTPTTLSLAGSMIVILCAVVIARLRDRKRQGT